MADAAPVPAALHGGGEQSWRSNTAGAEGAWRWAGVVGIRRHGGGRRQLTGLLSPSPPAPPPPVLPLLSLPVVENRHGGGRAGGRRGAAHWSWHAS